MKRWCFFCLLFLYESADVSSTSSTKPAQEKPDLDCPGGSFKNTTSSGSVVCSNCTQCDLQARPCQESSDTICCNDTSSFIKTESGIFECPKRPLFCRRGQRFNAYKSLCLPCPDGEFMPLDYHTMSECLKCQKSSKKFLPLHAVIIQECKSTQPALLRCEEGYFIDPAKANDVVCLTCKICGKDDNDKHIGRKCDYFNDTVCCPEPNMEVVDTHDGIICRKVCGIGQYHCINKKTGMATCHNCTSREASKNDPHQAETECEKCKQSSNMLRSQDSRDFKTLFFTFCSLFIAILCACVGFAVISLMRKYRHNKLRENRRLYFERQASFQEEVHLYEN